MTFPAQLENVSKYGSPATEIRLKDRILTNKQLTDFFTEIPKRLEIVELADDTANNVDVLALVDDLTQCITDVSDLKESLVTLNESATELQEKIGDKLAEGTIQYKLNELWNVIYDDGGVVWMITELQDDLLHALNNTIPEVQTDITNILVRNENQQEMLDEHELKINDIYNKLAQIAVNTAEINVIKAQVASMESKIEQIRTECNNNIANCANAIEALTERLDLM